MPWTWSPDEQHRLAYYVNSEALSILWPDVNVLDLLLEQDGKRKILESLYNKLLTKRVQYADVPSTTEGLTQDIRTPTEILETFHRGTCLDLALLFSGLCLGCELLPVVVVLDGHALVAVSRNHSLYNWKTREPHELKLFENALVGKEKVEQFKKLITSDAYLAVECTGFTHGQSQSKFLPEVSGRLPDGTLTFEGAITAGAAHFDRLDQKRFQYALDIVTAHRVMKIVPLSILSEEKGLLTRTASRFSSDDPLPYLLDRSEQENELKRAIIAHRSNSPRRPVICVIHGDEWEYHDAFLNRLHEISLPEILRPWYPQEVEQSPPLRRTMELSLSGITEKDWEDTIWRDLAGAIVGDRNAPADEIVSLIMSREVAVMINASLLSSDLYGVPLDKLDFFLEFWNRWPNLSEKLLLIVCLSLRYQKKHEIKRRKYQIWKSEGVNDALRRYVKNLKEWQFEAHKNLQGVCLELDAIHQRDAETAVKNELVKRSYNLTVLDVIRIYDQPHLCTPDGRIPMGRLLDEFHETRRRRQQ